MPAGSKKGRKSAKAQGAASELPSKGELMELPKEQLVAMVQASASIPEKALQQAAEKPGLPEEAARMLGQDEARGMGVAAVKALKASVQVDRADVTRRLLGKPLSALRRLSEEERMPIARVVVDKGEAQAGKKATELRILDVVFDSREKAAKLVIDVAVDMFVAHQRALGMQSQAVKSKRMAPVLPVVPDTRAQAEALEAETEVDGG